MDLTLLAVAVVVAAALTWWFMNPPRRNTPTEQRSAGSAGTEPVTPRRLDGRPAGPPPGRLDDRGRRWVVGLAAGLLLVLVVVAAFLLAGYR